MTELDTTTKHYGLVAIAENEKTAAQDAEIAAKRAFALDPTSENNKALTRATEYREKVEQLYTLARDLMFERVAIQGGWQAGAK